MTHPRLRRTSPISHFAMGAALEALGNQAAEPAKPPAGLGIVLCVLSGCVNYTRRFYDEVLRDPTTASPLFFPETVFNAPASHLAAYLGTTAECSTLVGDPGTFVTGLSLAADWLQCGKVDACLVIGAEESDWITADPWRHFERRQPLSEGAGALLLRSGESTGALAELVAVTEPRLHVRSGGRAGALHAMRRELRDLNGGLLCDSRCGGGRLDAVEAAAWADWSGHVMSPKSVLGEGLAAGSAWQCVAACDAIHQSEAATAVVSVAGTNEQAIGAVFRTPTT
jgi:3-oxoacyl-(acyl-carrier-protein) synthase